MGSYLVDNTLYMTLKKYYTLAEANTHWKGTIQQCKKELALELQKDQYNQSHYEEACITR